MSKELNLKSLAHKFWTPSQEYDTIIGSEVCTHCSLTLCKE